MRKNSIQGRSLGWVPDLPDVRDRTFSLTRVELPERVSLRELCPPIYDQDALGSCVGNAVSSVIDFVRRKQGLDFMFPSRLFLYYNARIPLGTTQSDSGCMIRDAIKSVVTDGVCHESDYPYVIARFKDRPDAALYAHAQKHQTLEYRRLDNRSLTQLKTCLAEGYPFVFGSVIYSSFPSNNPNVPMPGPGDAMEGGHCMYADGYDDASETFDVPNSWGTGVGDGGYFKIPYAYLTNSYISDDFWTIREVEAGDTPA